jgi:hypothetical protein
VNVKIMLIKGGLVGRGAVNNGHLCHLVFLCFKLRFYYSD